MHSMCATALPEDRRGSRRARCARTETQFDTVPDRRSHPASGWPIACSKSPHEEWRIGRDDEVIGPMPGNIFAVPLPSRSRESARMHAFCGCRDERLSPSTQLADILVHVRLQQMRLAMRQTPQHAIQQIPSSGSREQETVSVSVQKFAGDGNAGPVHRGRTRLFQSRAGRSRVDEVTPTRAAHRAQHSRACLATSEVSDHDLVHSSPVLPRRGQAVRLRRKSLRQLLRIDLICRGIVTRGRIKNLVFAIEMRSLARSSSVSAQKRRIARMRFTLRTPMPGMRSSAARDALFTSTGKNSRFRNAQASFGSVSSGRSGSSGCRQFFGAEAVKPHQPVRLVQAMLTNHEADASVAVPESACGMGLNAE